MHSTIKDTNVIFDEINLNYTSSGLSGLVDKDLMNDYKELLQDIASTRAYKVGEKILKSDLEQIKEQVKNIIENTAYVIPGAETSHKDNPTRAMLMLSDYLFITALKELGSPDIPPHFGEDVKDSINNSIKEITASAKNSLYGGVSTVEYYNAQRGKSASEVRNDNSEFLSNVRYNNLEPIHVAKLTAEYQALKMRQDNHIFLWRWFHRKENTARTELLNEMKAAIELFTEKGFDLAGRTPMDVANYMDQKRIDKETQKGFEVDGLAKRANYSSNVFAYIPTDTKRATEEMQNGASNDARLNIGAKKELNKLESIKRPGSMKDVRLLVKDNETRNKVIGVFVDILEKSDKTNADKELAARQLYQDILMGIGELWSSKDNMQEHAIKMFKDVYKKINGGMSKMGVVDKLVAAQKITDVILNVYSPVASDKSLKKFGEGYAIKNMKTYTVEDLTGIKENAAELIEDAKVELGIAQKNVRFDPEEFAENAPVISDKHEELDELAQSKLLK